MKTINIYRSDVRSYYPDETNGQTYAFAPIAGRVNTRPGTTLITGSVDGSDEPFITIQAPDGSHLAETNCGETALFVPSLTAGLSALEAYHCAKAHNFGLAALTP